MKILVVGLPGSGKTTQVERLSKDLDLGMVRMGAILRDLAKEDTQLGQMIKNTMATGALVTDKVVADIIKNEVQKDQYQNGFIMEGYPRTVEQINLFNPVFDKVFYLKVSIEAAKQRLMGRGRADDNPQAIEVRLKVQMQDMDKLLDFYKSSLVVIDGEKEIDEVYSDIKTDLK